MKLFRIETNDDSGIFDTDFQEDIIIKPNSQVALNQASFEINFEKLIVDASNSGFTYQVNDDGEIVGNFEHAIVDKSTYSGYLLLMQKSLNRFVNIALARNLGLQWKVFLDTNKRINIDYKISPIADYSSEFVLRAQSPTVVSYDPVDGSFSSDVAKANNYQFAMSPYTICNGGGQFRSQVQLYSNGDADTNLNGCAVVLLKKFIPAGINLLLKDIHTGVGFGLIANFYYYYSSVENNNAVKTFTDIVPVIGALDSPNNPILAIDVTEGQLKVRVYTQGGILEIFSVDYDQNTDLYPAIIFHGAVANIAMKNVRMTKDPWKSTPKSIILPHDPLQVVPLPVSSLTPANNRLILSSSVANFLDYTDTTYGIIIASEVSYIAENDFFKHNSNDMYIIELLNISVDSYDSYTQGRLNYLGMIPSANRYHVVYNANFPVWLAMNNEKELTIRNIKCRILNADRSPVSCFGKSNLVLLFDT